LSTFMGQLDDEIANGGLRPEKTIELINHLFVGVFTDLGARFFNRLAADHKKISILAQRLHTGKRVYAKSSWHLDSTARPFGRDPACAGRVRVRRQHQGYPQITSSNQAEPRLHVRTADVQRPYSGISEE